MDSERPLPTETLESLMHRYQQADANAASLLAEQLGAKLYAFYFSQVRNCSEAEDLLQDCWLRIHKSRHSYRPGEPLLPWVFAIARRAQIDRYRKSRLIANNELQNGHVGETHSVDSSSSKTDVFELLDTLPARQRETVLLLKVTGLTLEEVSRVTGASVGAVKQRAHRAYSTLRRLLQAK